MTCALVRRTTATGTRLAVQAPADRGEMTAVWVVLFDGLPMIEDGVPNCLAGAQVRGDLPATRAIYVESIEGAAKRGPTRCASLTTAATLDRFAGELEGFLAESNRRGRSHTVLVGHSLAAIAALHIAATHPALGNEVVLLSAALWWPGDNNQLSGGRVIDELLAAPDVSIWMSAGEQEEPKLLDSNDTICLRLSEAKRTFVRRSHRGGHEVRGEDVVDGIASLIDRA